MIKCLDCVKWRKCDHTYIEGCDRFEEFILKIPFPKCTETEDGSCGNGYRTNGLVHITEKLSCQVCKNRGKKNERKWSIFPDR